MEFFINIKKYILLLLLIISQYSCLNYLRSQHSENEVCWVYALSRGKGRYVLKESFCLPNEDYKDHFCIKKCPNNSREINNICWGECKNNTILCGALCLKDELCSGRIKDYAEEMFKKITDIDKEEKHFSMFDLRKLRDSIEFSFPRC